MPDSSYSRIYRVVGRIPRGRVATYGQVAAHAGLGSHARQVGYALHSLPLLSPVPWHRVINSRGLISRRARADGAELHQRLLLELEGVTFDAAGRVDLDRYRWRPRTRGLGRRSPRDGSTPRLRRGGRGAE